MNPETRAALETTLRRSVIAATPEQAEALRNKAEGMLAALLSERIISPLGHAAEMAQVTLARTQRAELKGSGK